MGKVAIERKRRAINRAMPPREWVGVYRDGARKLYLLPDGAWLLREASLPANVLKRAGLDPQLWGQWNLRAKSQGLEWQTLWRYLYTEKHPEGEALQALRAAGILRPQNPTFVCRDAEMKRFRKQSHRRAIERAARKLRSGNQGIAQSAVAIIVRCDLSAEAWYEDWLLRGLPLPSDVAVVPRAIARRMHFGLMHTDWEHAETYRTWFANEVFPGNTRDEVFRWVAWLYGRNPPAGWFVVPDAMLRIRQHALPAAICARASTPVSSLDQWEADPRLKAALDAARRAKRNGKSIDSLKDHPAWKGIRADAQRNIWRFAEEAALGRLLELAEVGSQYHAFLKQAAKLGCREDVERFLNGQLVAAGGKRLSAIGEFPNRLFIPSELMLEFRTRAAARAAEHDVWVLRRDETFWQGADRTEFPPTFQQLVLDLTLPRAHMDRPEGYRAMMLSTPEEIAACDEPEDWSFEPGRVVFRGHQFPLSGIPFRLLQKLTEKAAPVSLEAMLAAGWPSSIDDRKASLTLENIEPHLTALRKTLRRSLQLPERFNPIVAVEKGVLVAWELRL